MPRRVEPIRHARVTMRDDETNHAIGIDLALEAVQATHAVAVIDRLTPESSQLKANVVGRRLHAILDDERFVGFELPDATCV